MKNKILNVEFIAQTKTSGNCGPCSLKMVLNYHQKDNYSVQSLNKYLKVSKKWGCQEEDIENFLENQAIEYSRIKIQEIDQAIAEKKPVLVLFQDELHDGHYGVIIGFDQENYIFHDPWPEFGESFPRKKKEVIKRINKLGEWLITLN